MPTGLTAAVHDGDETLRGYLMKIGRQFGSFVEQREESLDEPPRVPERENRHVKYIEESKLELAKLQSMTPEQVEEVIDDRIDKSLASRERVTAKSVKTRERYDAMIEQVQRWVPAEGQGNVKEMALQQLRNSRQNDCWDDEQVNRFYPAVVERPDAKDWLAERIGFVKDSLARHEKDAAEAQKHIDERHKWATDFIDSLPVGEAIPAS